MVSCTAEALGLVANVVIDIIAISRTVGTESTTKRTIVGVEREELVDTAGFLHTVIGLAELVLGVIFELLNGEVVVLVAGARRETVHVGVGVNEAVTIADTDLVLVEEHLAGHLVLLLLGISDTRLRGADLLGQVHVVVGLGVKKLALAALQNVALVRVGVVVVVHHLPGLADLAVVLAVDRCAVGEALVHAVLALGVGVHVREVLALGAF